MEKTDILTTNSTSNMQISQNGIQRSFPLQSTCLLTIRASLWHYVMDDIIGSYFLMSNEDLEYIILKSECYTCDPIAPWFCSNHQIDIILGYLLCFSLTLWILTFPPESLTHRICLLNVHWKAEEMVYYHVRFSADLIPSKSDGGVFLPRGVFQGSTWKVSSGWAWNRKEFPLRVNERLGEWRKGQKTAVTSCDCLSSPTAS